MKLFLFHLITNRHQFVYTLSIISGFKGETVSDLCAAVRVLSWSEHSVVSDQSSQRSLLSVAQRHHQTVNSGLWEFVPFLPECMGMLRDRSLELNLLGLCVDVLVECTLWEITHPFMSVLLHETASGDGCLCSSPQLWWAEHTDTWSCSPPAAASCLAVLRLAARLRSRTENIRCSSRQESDSVRWEILPAYRENTGVGGGYQVDLHHRHRQCKGEWQRQPMQHSHYV